MRFFKNRKDVDKVCLMKGRMPEKSGEIAVDRMYAENNSLEIGDRVKSGKKAFRITGLVALSDYSALFPCDDGYAALYRNGNSCICLWNYDQ